MPHYSKKLHSHAAIFPAHTRRGARKQQSTLATTVPDRSALVTPRPRPANEHTGTPYSPKLRLLEQLYEQHGEENVMDEVARTIQQIAKCWQLNDTEVTQLMAITQTMWEQIQGGTRSSNFNQEQIQRMSAALGTYLALHLCFDESQADRWIRNEHLAPLFEGQSPIDFMMRRGLTGMVQTRNYADALKVGL